MSIIALAAVVGDCGLRRHDPEQGEGECPKILRGVYPGERKLWLLMTGKN